MSDGALRGAQEAIIFCFRPGNTPSTSKEPQLIYQCVFCKNLYESMQQVQSHFDEAHPKKYKCEFCGVKFRTNEGLDLHVAKKHETDDWETVDKKDKKKSKPKMIYKCGVCNKKLSRFGLVLHLRTVHVEESPFTCDTCGMRFKIKERLAKHMKQHGERNFQCPICLKKFATNTDMKKHKDRVHGPVVYEQCETCGKTMKKEILRSHRKTHLERDQRKTYTCPICGKRVLSLKGHMAIHKNVRRFCCDLCGKRFNSRHYMEVHIKFHLKIRDYKCNICGKKVFFKRGLLNHMHTHDSEAQFECSVCGRKFKNQSYIKRHMFLVHEKNKK